MADCDANIMAHLTKLQNNVFQHAKNLKDNYKHEIDRNAQFLQQSFDQLNNLQAEVQALDQNYCQKINQKEEELKELKKQPGQKRPLFVADEVMVN